MRFAGTALAIAVVSLGGAAPAAAGGTWVWPVEGPVLTHYANDNGRPYAGGMHRGIDIAAREGAPVVAACEGTVTHAGVVGSSGLTVAVRTADGAHVTSYLHLSTVAVKKGVSVATGARVGEIGTTGRRTVAEPHLHFGVRLADRDDHYVDPLSLLPAITAPGAAPTPPVPATAPVRADPRPVPVSRAAPLRIAPGARPAPGIADRPSGAMQAGPVARPEPVREPVAARSRPASRPRPQPRPVPAGPEPARAARPAHVPVPADRPVAEPAARSGPGRELVLAGLGVIGLVLFGGMAGRALSRANGGVNARAAAAASLVRDQLRIGPALRRLLSPLDG